LEVQNPSVAAFRRTYQGESVIAIHNLSDSSQTTSFAIKSGLKDLLTNGELISESRTLELAPFQSYWLKA
jgi:hypothetical protein